MSQYDPMFDLKRNVGYCDLYFIALYLEDYLMYMYEHHTLGLWPDVLPKSKCRSL